MIPGPHTLRRICKLTRRFVEPHKHLRQIHRFESDRKAHEDAKPRVRRTGSALEPMEIIVGDVHHLDVLIRREDGSVATPKMIGWLDMGTRRVFANFVLCLLNQNTGRSEGIRNEHVIASFISMTQDPGWGMPRTLYLDNGSEYNFADFIDDALKLVSNHRLRLEQTVRSQPYNAPAKAIEGTFGLLERAYFSQIPGWIGGNRMITKTANVGRAPEPCTGDMSELERVLRAYLTLYESQSQRGELNGRSPAEVFAQAVKAGWRRTDVDPHALRVAFSEERTRKVRQGSIEVRGRCWTCPELHAYLGEWVTVLIPKYDDWSVLPVRDDQGRLLGYAEPDLAYHPLDSAGARESRRRSTRQEKSIRAAARETPRRDLVGEAIALAEGTAPPPVPESNGVITLNSDAATMGRAIAEKPQQREARRQSELEAEQCEALERSERSLEAARRAAQRKSG